MNIKTILKWFVSFFIIALIVLVGFAFYFYQTQLQGVAPAIQVPRDDIENFLSVLDQENNPSEDDVVAPAENVTNFTLDIPEGFRLSVFAQGFEKPRVLKFGPGGYLFLSDTDAGKIYALRDGEKKEILSGLYNPHGIEFRCREKCQMYIAQTDQVLVYDINEETLQVSNPQKIVELPDDGGHYTRTLLFLPQPNEDTLLISVGSSCNVCQEEDERRAKVLAVDYDGNNLRDYSIGLRNAVFMTHHPVTGKTWVTEMGRDLLGDDIPPDEINILEDGGNFGWPNCYGKNIHDTDYDQNTYIRNPCSTPFEIPSHIDIPAHSAPLGLAFIPEEGWPQSMWYDMLVAYHGSWNRSEPTGYKIVRMKLDENGQYVGSEDFISGWVEGNKAVGRPVDIVTTSGGIAYISDDRAGVVYKLERIDNN